MKTTNQNTDKLTYNAPMMERIHLDNEISLALESNPPFGPEETGALMPDYFKNDPFKQNVG